MKESFFSRLNHYVMGDSPLAIDDSEYKRVLLTGQFGVLGVLLCFVYIIVDYFNDNFIAIAVYVVLAFIMLLVVGLNKRGHHTSAKATLLLTGNIITYLFAAREVYGTGSFLFFLMVIFLGFALFDYTEVRKSIAFSLLSIMLFFLAYFTDFTLLPPAQMNPESVKVNFMINFGILSAFLFFIVFFIIRINYFTESNLKASQQDLKKALKKLDKSQQRFELAIKGSSAGIWDYDMVKDKIYTSPLMREMLGFPEEKFDDANIDSLWRIVHPSDKHHLLKAMLQHLHEQKPFSVELRLRTYDRGYRWMLDTGQAEWDTEGNPVRMVGTLVDIHAGHEAEERVRQQNEMLAKTNEELDRFVYSTSHDLRAPLSSVLGLINIMELTPSEEERKQIIGMMRTRVKNLDDFIQEIIDYSRNSRMEVVYEKINFRELYKEVLDNLKFMEEVGQIDMQLELTAEEFHSDKKRLKVILNNLVSNAIKYHLLRGENPYIQVKMEKTPHHVAITVEDNGRGIPAESMDKIFDMFYRATEDSKGSGLGLYIVKETVQKMGGKIHVKSDLGAGTTFVLELPLKPATTAEVLSA
jgi:PAS domain S-box-containing protein